MLVNARDTRPELSRYSPVTEGPPFVIVNGENGLPVSCWNGPLTQAIRSAFTIQHFGVGHKPHTAASL